MFFDNLFDDYDPFGTFSYRQPRPQTSSLYREDKKSMILRDITNDEYNYMCFDCHRELNNLDYFDIKNGIFLCGTCAQHLAKLSKEITKPMTGHIKSLDENDLLILYYGGNKNLFEFIRRYFPLLENMKEKEMLSTKAMDYYRKLLRSKAYDEPEPQMPGKKKAYTSIFQKKENPATERKQKNIREKKVRESFDRNDDIDNLFSSTFFGDDLFNRNRQQRKKTYDNENDYFENESADINKKETEENDDAGMKVEKRSNSHESKEPKKANEEPKYKKIEIKENIENKEEEKENKGEEKENKEEEKENKEEEKENKEEEKENKEEIRINTIHTLTVNQIGDINFYPEAMEIDEMDCD